jgi:energy-coupling factor transport system ATP-binding protein
VSGGELQKAALAKVLASRPKVLLLDEPAKGIDVNGKGELAAILKELTAEGVAVLSVTHDAEWAAEHADRCGLLFDGEVISEGEPSEFFAGNAFYTTAANRMAGDLFPGVATCDDLLRALEVSS